MALRRSRTDGKDRPPRLRSRRAHDGSGSHLHCRIAQTAASPIRNAGSERRRPRKRYGSRVAARLGVRCCSSIKAKLEAVEAGITEFESEFLAHIVLPRPRDPILRGKLGRDFCPLPYDTDGPIHISAERAVTRITLRHAQSVKYSGRGFGVSGSIH